MRRSGGSSQHQRGRKRIYQPKRQGQGWQPAIVTEGGGSPEPEKRPRRQARKASSYTLAGQAEESAMIMETQSPTGKPAVEAPI